MEVNSLWGAVLVQGILLAKYLRNDDRNLRITETHPKALLCLLKAHDRSKELEELLEGKGIPVDGSKDEDCRDAVISAYAAWHMVEHGDANDWKDLFCEEYSWIELIDRPVSYWMFIPEKGKAK